MVPVPIPLPKSIADVWNVVGVTPVGPTMPEFVQFVTQSAVALAVLAGTGAELMGGGEKDEIMNPPLGVVGLVIDSVVCDPASVELGK